MSESGVRSGTRCQFRDTVSAQSHGVRVRCQFRDTVSESDVSSESRCQSQVSVQGQGVRVSSYSGTALAIGSVGWFAAARQHGMARHALTASDHVTGRGADTCGHVTGPHGRGESAPLITAGRRAADTEVPAAGPATGSRVTSNSTLPRLIRCGDHVTASGGQTVPSLQTDDNRTGISRFTAFNGAFREDRLAPGDWSCEIKPHTSAGYTAPQGLF